MAMGNANSQWADMMYTSLMPKPKPMCKAMSKAAPQSTIHMKRDRRPHHTPAAKSSTTRPSTT